MSTALAPRERVNNVRALLEKAKPQIAMALPKHVTPERMMRVFMTCVQTNPRLLECTDVSLMGALIKAAQLGLEPDTLGARAFIIPRRNNRKGVMEANFQPGFQGLMDLARRSKEIATFEAREVYAGDKFIYTFGIKPTLVHVPGGETNEAKITHVYAICQLLNGRAQFEVMTRDQLEEHRKRYSKDQRDDSVWRTNWPAMAKKTVIIKLCKYLPASVELREAVALQERDDAGVPQDLAVSIDLPELVAEKPSKLDALTTELERKDEAAGPVSQGIDGGDSTSADAGSSPAGASTPDPSPDDVLDAARRAQEQEAMATEEEVERQALLAKIKELGQRLSDPKKAALWAKHVGAAVKPEAASLDSLRALREALGA